MFANVVKVGENNTLQITSSIIGIFAIKFFALYELEEQVFLNSSFDIEVIVGRSKVAENILVNIMFSFGMGFALLIMGMEIEVDQIIKAIKYARTINDSSALTCSPQASHWPSCWFLHSVPGNASPGVSSWLPAA